MRVVIRQESVEVKRPTPPEEGGMGHLPVSQMV